MIMKAKTWQATVRILCALVLFAIGFAHKPPVFEQQMSAAEIAAYTLPDGTIPVLCHSLDHDGSEADHPQKHEANTVCEVCRLAASILIPAPADTTGVMLQIATENPSPVTVVVFARPVLVASAAPRAPPANTSLI